MSGPWAVTQRACAGMAMRTGDEVVAADIARDETSILMVTTAGYGKRTQLHHFHRQNRGGLGVGASA